MEKECETLDDLNFLDGAMKYYLKQEAIKQIKFLQQLPEGFESLKKIHKDNLDEKFFALFDSIGSYDNSNVIDWIKFFFNISEKEVR